MPGRMRRAAALGATAKVASNRGQAKGAAAAEQAAAAAAAPPVPPAAPAAPVAAEPTSTGAVDNYDALMKLKGLLDAGVLSQEEFDAEKRKMLGA